MNPVFRGLPDKILLRTTSSSISFNGVALGPDQIVKLRKLHYKSIVVILEKRFGVETCSEDRFEMPIGLFLEELGHKTNPKNKKRDIHHVS